MTSPIAATLVVTTLTSSPAAGVSTPAVTPLSVTFYKDSTNPNALLYATLSKEPFGTIKENGWIPQSVWTDAQFKSLFFSLGVGQGRQVYWGTEAAALNSTLVVLSSASTSQITTSTAGVPSSSSVTSGDAVTSAAPPNQTSSATTGASPTSPTSPPNSQGSNKGLSGGEAAGLAIGCLIAGALIAGLIFWFCWGKRKQSRARDYEASRTALMPHEKGFATDTIPLGSGNPAAAPVAGALPLPLEDKAVTGEISKISNSIKNHVQSYYQMGRVSPGLIDLDDIHALGSSQPIAPGTLSTLLDSATTREIALRFCIAWVVCSRMQPGADSKTSLLPVELAGCMGKMTNERRGSPGHSASELARWRVTTAELMQGSYVRDPFTASDSRNGSVQTAANTLENILRPFADSRMDNGERRRNLEEILKRSALFAFTLFSQPSTWGFDWRETQGVKSGELCIFPALVQLTNETGQAINPPRPFSEAVIRRLDE